MQRACCDAYGIMISVVTSDEAHWYVILCCAERNGGALSRVPIAANPTSGQGFQLC